MDSTLTLPEVPQPHGVEYTSGKITFLNDAQSHSSIDRADEISDEFIAACALALPPQLYYCSVVPCNTVKQTRGGILLADQAVDHQKWTHGLGMVIATGPAVYRGRTFQELGLEPKDGPQSGDLVLYDPKIPKKLQFDWKGRPREVVMVADHAFYAHVRREDINKISFVIV